MDYRLYHKSVDATFFEDFITTLKIPSPTTTFNDVFGRIEEKEPGFNFIILHNGVQLKSSDQPLEILYPNHSIHVLVTSKSKETAYILYQVDLEGVVIGMSLLSVAPTDTVEQLINTFKKSRIYTSEGQYIEATSKGLLSTYFPNNKILIYLFPDADPINMGTPVQPITFKLSGPEEPILMNVDIEEPVFEQTVQTPLQFEPIPISTRSSFPRTVSPPRSSSSYRERSSSPYRERSNSPFRVRSEELHKIDPRKLSYERSTVDNDVYSTNDLIFLLMERGIEPPRSKREMVDILRIVISEERNRKDGR